MNEWPSLPRVLASTCPAVLPYPHENKHLWTRTSLIEIGQKGGRMRQNSCNVFQVA